MISSATECRHFHLHSPGPKRILSLDGGGIRGVISLAFIERLETILRDRTGQADFRISDYFDLIGGTSTGSIIAVGLALGHSASHLIDLYLNLAKKGFKRHRWIGGPLAPKFDANSLRSAIFDQFGAETLGSENLRCGIGIVAKRLDTGSVWLFHNHPRGPFFQPESSEITPNRDLLLADLLRASTAAPTYFAPEWLTVAPGIQGLFVDGGVSPHNNPALLLLMLATLQGYGFRWPLGAQQLMLTSLGTGSPQSKSPFGTLEHLPPALLAVHSLRSVVQDCSSLVQTILQWMSASPNAWKIDSEIGDLKDDQLSGSAMLHYLRFDLPLSSAWCQTELGLNISHEEIELLKQFDRPDQVARLLEIGRMAAEKQIKAEYFPCHFDL